MPERAQAAGTAGTSGFNGTIHVSGEATDESANLVNICLTEICNNILKHGTHSYVVRIRFGERTTLVASNEIAAGEAQPDSAHHGLEMLESRPPRTSARR